MFCKLLLILLSVSSIRSCSDVECLSEMSDRMHGGVSTQKNSRPFQAALILRVGEDGEIGFCGGSLVHPQWVMTAAHCCYHGGRKITHGQVILGAHSLYDSFENGRRMVNVDEVVVHPDWNPDNLANDIALLKLANIIQITDRINTIRLPYLRTVMTSFSGQRANASGWGIAANGVNFISPTLREKASMVMTNSFCSSHFQNYQLPENVICTLSTGAGTCKGDNGGPLTIFFNDTEENILVGVASFVEADGCNTDLPNVFTRVQNFLPWISDVTAGTTAYVRIPQDYHLEVGIPAATRIKEAEDKILSGQSKGDSPSRIIGGSVAPAEAHPYLAGLLITFFNHGGTSACGSSLISADRLVTGAHCWDTGSFQVRQFLVVLGSQFLFSGGTRIATNNVVLHPQWRRQFLTNDIAIIYLPTKVHFSSSIRPIALPENNGNTFEGQLATAAGYGKTSDAQSGVNINSLVSHVNVFIMANFDCQKSYGPNYIRPNVMCTDGAGGVGICGGDSGGPLLVRNRMGEEVLVGISSFAADKACERGHPSGFVRVTSFIDFIRQHL